MLECSGSEWAAEGPSLSGAGPQGGQCRLEQSGADVLEQVVSATLGCRFEIVCRHEVETCLPCTKESLGVIDERSQNLHHAVDVSPRHRLSLIHI